MFSEIVTQLVLLLEGLVLSTFSFSHGRQNSFDIINYVAVTENLTALILEIS